MAIDAEYVSEIYYLNKVPNSYNLYYKRHRKVSHENLYLNNEN